MKAIIVFDSVYGCTKTVGETIADTLKEKGWETEIICLKNSQPEKIDCDLLFVGSPTRFGKYTKRVKKFFKGDALDSFSGKAVSFDTIMHVDENDPKAEKTKSKYVNNGAAPTIKSDLIQKGIKVYDFVLRVEVSGLKGPLVDDAENTVKSFMESFLQSE